MSTPDAHEDVFDQHRATLRAQGFVPNPYRVGVQVGKTDGDQWRRQERSLGKKR